MLDPTGPRAAPDQGRLLGALRRNWWIPVITTVVAAAAAYYLSSRDPERFTATSLIQFLETRVDREVLGDSQGSNDTNTISATNVVLVRRKAVADAASQKLGGISSSEVRDEIAISAEPDTSIVRIQATDEDPGASARIANAYAQAFIELDRKETRQQLVNARAVVRREREALPRDQLESARAYQLADRETQLDLLLGARQDRVRLIQQADAPSSPSTASPARNTLLGGLLGLLLGLGIAALRDQSDRRVRSEEDLEEAFGLPLLGSVPTSRALRRRHTSLDELPPREAEVFRMLQAQMRYTLGADELVSTAFTSATAGEGKTTIAWHFAAAMAAAHARVLFIEADMRRPTVADKFGLRADGGLTDVIERSSDPAELVQTVDAVSGRTMDVLVAGSAHANPADLAQSPAAADLIRWGQANYDFVVLDAPPLTAVSDALPVAKLADCVIVVARRDQALPARIRRLRTQLRALDVRVLGLVANGYDDTARDRAYDYS